MEGTFSIRRILHAIAGVILIAAFALSGCRQLQKPFYPAAKCPEELSFDVPLCPEPKQCSCEDVQRIKSYLDKRDIKMFQVGEDVKVVIPADHLFKPHSANFNPKFTYVLAPIEKLIWCHHKEDVKIAAFTDCYGDPDRNEQLTTLQAQKVAKFLWGKGVDTRVLYSKGYGRQQPITNNHSYYARSRNRRVEITFRSLPNW